jgi:hypothetical protein
MIGKIMTLLLKKLEDDNFEKKKIKIITDWIEFDLPAIQVMDSTGFNYFFIHYFYLIIW